MNIHPNLSIQLRYNSLHLNDRFAHDLFAPEITSDSGGPCMKRPTVVALALALATITPTLAQGPPDPKALKADLLKADLFIAVTKHNLAGVKTALSKGADPNSRNWLEFTPLMWAAMRGDRNIIDELEAHKAQVNATSIYGSALSFALTGRRSEIANYLLDKGCDPNVSRIDGLNPLMIAALNGDTAIVSRLLK